MARLRREGYVAGLIDPEPTYISLMWLFWLNTNWLPEDHGARLPFNTPAPPGLSGTLGFVTPDPDVRLDVVLSTRISKDIWDDGISYQRMLNIDRVRLAFPGYVLMGQVKTDSCEMDQATVALPNICPQQYADVAATALNIDTSGEWPLWFYAALRPAERCQICARPLSDPVSQALYIGPDCARRLGMEHSPAMAKAVMQARENRGQA
jgi:hypothetical protein